MSILFGTVLGFADPITDTLTLVEFYRATFFFVLFNYNSMLSDDESCGIFTCIFCSNPFCPAFVKLRMLCDYLEKLPNLWRGNKIEPTDINENPLNDLDEELPGLSALAILAEAVLESAPQFIIQLYVMAIQQERCRSFKWFPYPCLSSAWLGASTVADRTLHGDLEDLYFSVKFVTHLFILSSRLFAVALFTVSYKWWVTSVLILHCTVITLGDFTKEDCGEFAAWFSFCFHWL